ncbi:MAG TPA: hypothetical protein VJQ47_05840 [Steroidobacteraceae bacterium]|nr:hypothetical protein [Steroidobacteraceae bacterium]
MLADQDTALAIVHRGKNHRPLLRHCAIHPAIEIKAEQVLAPLSRNRDLADAGISGVLGTDDYELVQLEAPDVQPAEMRSAVRWKLRDIISFPATDAIVDVFEIPEQARYVENRMIFAVAARSEAVDRVVRLIQPRVPGFDVLDIPELCLRNLTALLPQDADGVALIALGSHFAQLVLTCQGILYLARRIDLRPVGNSPRDGGEAASVFDVEALAVELQRSLDYYESHYDRQPITQVVLTSGDERAAAISDSLQTHIGMSVELLDVRELFEVAPGVDPDTRWLGLLAVGAALRTEGAS